MFDRLIEALCVGVAVVVVVFATVWAFTEAASIETSQPQMPRFARVTR